MTRRASLGCDKCEWRRIARNISNGDHDGVQSRRGSEDQRPCGPDIGWWCGVDDGEEHDNDNRLELLLDFGDIT